MSIDTSIYRLVEPKSETDSNYEQFEFVLAWYGRNGEYINYMFTDWEGQNNYSVSQINIQSQSDLQNIIGQETRNITVWAENITINDLHVLSSIFQAKKILRIFKDGTIERIGIANNSLGYRQTNGRYDMKIDIILYERALPQ
jgi:hypothetical protein